MFVKYSALALCFSLAMALEVVVPPITQTGTLVELAVATVSEDPSTVDLLLCVSNGSFDIVLATDVPVAESIEVDIPAHVPPRPDYFIAAIEVGNSGIIYSKSNLFEIDSALILSPTWVP